MNIRLRLKQEFSATPHQVWQALTDSKKMRIWYFDIPDFDLKVGATFNFYEPGEERKFHHRSVIKEIKVDEKLKYTWTYPGQSTGESTVCWEIKKIDAGSKVVLTHMGIENFADGGEDFALDNFRAGWTSLLKESLKQFLDK